MSFPSTAGSIAPVADRREALVQLGAFTTGSVLDVGTGAGIMAVLLAKHGLDVVAVDIEDRALDVARENARKSQVAARITFQKEDGRRLRFLDNTFDYVVAFNSLHHFIGVQQALSEMARVCRPGGRIAVLEYNIQAHSLFRELDVAFKNSIWSVDGSRRGEIASLLSKTSHPPPTCTVKEIEDMLAEPCDIICSSTLDAFTVAIVAQKPLTSNPVWRD